MFFLFGSKLTAFFFLEFSIISADSAFLNCKKFVKITSLIKEAAFTNIYLASFCLACYSKNMRLCFLTKMTVSCFLNIFNYSVFLEECLFLH